MIKGRKYISWLLMIVSIIMLTASALPHHHHQDFLCLQHDVECSETTTTPLEHQTEDSECKACCVTKFVCPTPQQQDMQMHNLPFVTLFIIPEILKLIITDEPESDTSSVYTEFLHGICFSRFIGLRAPPSLV